MKKLIFRPLYAHAIAIAAVLAVAGGMTVTPVATTQAVAANSTEPAPASKPKAKKRLRKKGKKALKGKKRRRRKNFSSGAVDPALLAPVNPSNIPELTLANAQIKSGDYRTAITTLNALDRPNDANVLNLLGFSHRKLGLIDVGMRYYLAALENNPQHRGVHEYLGEAYLQKDDLSKAQVMLKKLGKICGQGCSEYKELAAAISEYEKKHTL